MNVKKKKKKGRVEEKMSTKERENEKILIKNMSVKNKEEKDEWDKWVKTELKKKKNEIKKEKVGDPLAPQPPTPQKKFKLSFFHSHS